MEVLNVHKTCLLWDFLWDSEQTLHLWYTDRISVMMSSLSSLFLVAELSSCLLGCVSIRYIIRKESFIILKMQVQRKGEFIETSLVGFQKKMLCYSNVCSRFLFKIIIFFICFEVWMCGKKCPLGLVLYLQFSFIYFY